MKTNKTIKALVLAAAAGAPLAFAMPARADAGCVGDQVTIDASLDQQLAARQDRNDWALQCAYISQTVYGKLYPGGLSWDFVSFAIKTTDPATNKTIYTLWQPESFSAPNGDKELKRDGQGRFLYCSKPSNVILFSLCPAPPSDG